MKRGVSQSRVQSDATDIIFLSWAVFVFSAVSRWCVCVCCAWCAVFVAASSSTRPRSWVPLSCFQPSSTVHHMSVYGDVRFCFAFSFRIQQRLGDSGVFGGSGGGGGGGGGCVAAAELFNGAGRGGRQQVTRRRRVHCGGASAPVHRQSVPRVVS